jgi:hypothetical protein
VLAVKLLLICVYVMAEWLDVHWLCLAVAQVFQIFSSFDVCFSTLTLRLTGGFEHAYACSAGKTVVVDAKSFVWTYQSVE